MIGSTRQSLDAKPLSKSLTKPMPNIRLSASAGWSSETSSIFCRTRKMRVLFLWLLAVIIAPAEVGAAEKLVVAFPSLATALSPSWITAERGLWQKYGLEVELIYLDGGSRSVSALIGGSAQLIFGSDVLVTVANLQGADLIPARRNHQYTRLCAGNVTRHSKHGGPERQNPGYNHGSRCGLCAAV